MTVPRRQLDRAGTALEPLSTRKRWEKRGPLGAEREGGAPTWEPVTDALRLRSLGRPGVTAGRQSHAITDALRPPRPPRGANTISISALPPPPPL